MMHAKYDGSTLSYFGWCEVIYASGLHWIRQSAMRLYPFLMTRITVSTRAIDTRNVVTLRRSELRSFRPRKSLCPFMDLLLGIIRDHVAWCEPIVRRRLSDVLAASLTDLWEKSSVGKHLIDDVALRVVRIQALRDQGFCACPDSYNPLRS